MKVCVAEKPSVAKEIADILGFEDQASFSRFFKNMTGQSAVQFRNTQEGKN